MCIRLIQKKKEIGLWNIKKKYYNQNLAKFEQRTTEFLKVDLDDRASNCEQRITNFEQILLETEQETAKLQEHLN
jgi:hypothetical protein